MDEVVPAKKKVSYSLCGCLSVLALVAILSLAFYTYSSTRGARVKESLDNAMDVVKQTPPSSSMSNEDAEVLTVWMYFDVKFGQDVDDFNATEENSNGRLQATEQLVNLLKIKHSLPTNAKYKPLTDSIQAVVQKRIDLILKGKGSEPLDDETMQNAVLENMKKFGGDIRYVSDVLPKDERNRILNRYYGSL